MYSTVAALITFDVSKRMPVIFYHSYQVEHSYQILYDNVLFGSKSIVSPRIPYAIR